MIEFSALEIIAIVLLSLIAFRVVLSILSGFWTCFLGYKLGFGIKWRTGENVWAVITGATDGIGLEYAKQLANIGYNLVIISRNEDKLKATQKFLTENYKSCKKVKIISADFSRTDIYDKIAEELQDLEEIFVLVNNVGTIYHIPEYYLKIPKEFTQNNLTINMVSATKMIELVLPKMVKKRRGVIINISSQIGEFPIPLYTTYGATKAYLNFLSQSLSVEYQSKGVYIQTVVPNQLATKLTVNVRVPLLSLTPEDYVSAAIKTVGIEHYTYGHWKHKLLAFFSKFGPPLFGDRLYMKLMYFNVLKMRQNYYRTNKLSDE